MLNAQSINKILAFTTSEEIVGFCVQTFVNLFLNKT